MFHKTYRFQVSFYRVFTFARRLFWQIVFTSLKNITLVVAAFANLYYICNINLIKDQ